jgi:RimJ/RimL family protein N-acetyltransferase
MTDWPRVAMLPSSPRLAFRSWREDDLDVASSLWGDPRVTRLLDARGALAPADVRARLRAEIDREREYGFQYWPLFLRDGGGFVGCSGLKRYDDTRRILEIGFHLCAGAWGRGLATEAGRAVIAVAFEQLGATALFAGHHPENTGSKRALERLGFVYSHHEFFAPTGLQHPGYFLRPEPSGAAKP